MFILKEAVKLFSYENNDYCPECWGDNEITEEVVLYTENDLEQLNKIARCDECNKVIWQPE